MKAIEIYLQMKLDEHVRPEIQELVKRGNITLNEYRALRCNSWEWEHVYSALDNEAFAECMSHNLKNCANRARPCATYDEACTNILAPELLKRFKGLINLNKEKI